jgi:hypothetical protein
MCFINGDREWLVEGKHHREDDLPAITCALTGRQEWYMHGQRHRAGDRPAVVVPGGLQEWFVDGAPHREGDSPAVVHPVWGKAWFRHGLRHRGFGRPACESPDGQPLAYWIDGARVTAEEAERHHAACQLLKYRWLVPRLYDPATPRGMRRLNASYDEVFGAEGQTD